MAQIPKKTATGGWVTSDIQLDGKTVLITGANRGIGLETAIDLAKRGAKVIIACRNLDKAELAKERICRESGSQKVVVKSLNLASLASVRKLADDVVENEQRLDVLINNAGIFRTAYCETEDGYEMHFGVNHLGHFLLTNMLLELLKKSAPSRVITVSSAGHRETTIDWEDPNRRKRFNTVKVYCQSKLMNVLFSRELSTRLQGTGVTSNSLHPGVVRTEIDQEAQDCCSLPGCLGCIVWCMANAKCTMKSAEHGAQTTIYCAIAPELENVTGKYFVDCKIKTESRDARNDESARRLWEISDELTQARPATEGLPAP